MIEPTRHLVPLSAPDPTVTLGFANPLAVFDALSISFWVNEFLKELVGYDAIDELTKPFAGDWASFWQAGDAFANAGYALYDLGTNLHEGARALDLEWDGNAGDAAYVYFTRLAASVSGQHEPLLAMQQQYHDAARAIWLFADQVASLIRSIIDKAIVAAIAAAAGTAAAETVVGAVAGYAVAAWQTIEILDRIADASLKIQAAGTLINGVFGALMALANEGGDLSQHPLPGTAYTHPAKA